MILVKPQNGQGRKLIMPRKMILKKRISPEIHLSVFSQCYFVIFTYRLKIGKDIEDNQIIQEIKKGWNGPLHEIEEFPPGSTSQVSTFMI